MSEAGVIDRIVQFFVDNEGKNERTRNMNEAHYIIRRSMMARIEH